MAAEASLALLEQVSAPAIERQVRNLAARLASGFAELGLPLVGPATGSARGAMVCVGELGAGRHDSVQDPRMSSLHAHLQAHDICLSVRRGMLRFSLHAYNNDSDVDTVLELTRSWQQKRRHVAA